MEKNSSLRNIKLYSEPFYGKDKKYIKAKIKMFQDEVNTDFQGNGMPKQNVSYDCFSLIVLDSGIIVNE